MKKTLPILGLCILLVGCGSSETAIDSKIKDGDKVVIEGSEISITKNDIYKYMIDQFGSNQILDTALTYIADKEITDTEAIDKKVTEKLDQYKEQLTDGIDAYVKQLGFASEEEYINNSVKPAVKKEMLKDQYVTENLDKLTKSYNVHYLKVITVATEDAAKEIIKKSKTTEEFNTQLTNNSGQDIGIVTKDSTSIDANVIAALDKFSKDGIYSKPIATSDNKFAVVYVYNTNKKDLKEDIKTHLLTVSGIENDYKAHYLKKYKFDVYENKLKDELKDANKDYFG